MMRLGIFAKTFEGSDPALVLDQVASTGFSAAQYNMACSGLPSMPDHISEGVAEAVAHAARTCGIEIAAVSGTYNMIHPDPSIRDLGHARLAVLAAACRDLATRLVTLCTGTRDPHDQWRADPANDTPEAWRDLLAGMERAVAIAEEHEVDLGIEPELANVVSTAAKARLLIDEIGSARVKIVLDPANLFEREPAERRRGLVAQAIDLLGDRIAIAHAKDRTEEGGFTTAGKGVLDYAHYVGCLRDVGFDGPIIAHGLSAEEAPGVARFLRSVLDEAGVRVHS